MAATQPLVGSKATETAQEAGSEHVRDKARSGCRMSQASKPQSPAVAKRNDIAEAEADEDAPTATASKHEYAAGRTESWRAGLGWRKSQSVSHLSPSPTPWHKLVKYPRHGIRNASTLPGCCKPFPSARGLSEPPVTTVLKRCTAPLEAPAASRAPPGSPASAVICPEPWQGAKRHQGSSSELSAPEAVQRRTSSDPSTANAARKLPSGSCGAQSKAHALMGSSLVESNPKKVGSSPPGDEPSSSSMACTIAFPSREAEAKNVTES
mmetsp:Transcript_70988/g.179070  ORF Transcript_70988/g.179070 Transcript_70988/m.179070 type:complete len:266 (-) Transcript_70988:510-1307(-)